MSSENSTDATRGEPLALRARKRKADLERALDNLPARDLSARNDIQIALSAVETMLAGDFEHLSNVTASQISRWLESTKHLAETTPSPAGTTTTQK